MIGFNYNDGGRAAAGFKGTCKDCAIRAIAIATGKNYKDIYTDIRNLIARFNEEGKINYRKSVRQGVPAPVSKYYLEQLGWRWVPTMKFGKGCTMHLDKEELPSGIIIARLSRHLTAVIDGIINDTYDCSRDGNRCVYGYFVKED